MPQSFSRNTMPPEMAPQWPIAGRGVATRCRRVIPPELVWPTSGRLRLLVCAWLAIATLLAVAHPRAEEWLDVVKGLHPYASIAATHDSNLLRLSRNAGSDTYSTLEAGFSTDFDVSRQRFLIDGRIYRNDYDRFSQFDYTGGHALALWKWIYGRPWKGELGFKYDRRLRDLANQLIPAKDLIDRSRFFGEADRWLNERWLLGMRANWTNVSFSERADLDKRLLGGGIDLDYVSRAGNSVGLESNYTDAHFSDASRRDYREWFLGPNVDWQITGKTRLSATAGYLQRDHDTTSERDFQGPVGRLTAVWEATGKTLVSASVWREISNLKDEVANYAIIDGISLEPTWALSAKTALRAAASYEQRDFEGSQPDIENIEERMDDIYSVELWLDWDFLRNGRLSLGYRAENRDSTRTLQEYDYRYVRAQLRLGL